MKYKEYRYVDDQFSIKRAPTKVNLHLKEAAIKAEVHKCTKEIDKLQKVLYAQRTYGVIMVLQALDAAGKDSLIAHVFSGVNPVGVRVANFKQPSSTELRHDYLWRINQQLPERGQIGIFNRSYYEDVLVSRVHPEILLGEHLPGIETLADIHERFYQDRYQDLRDYEAYLNRNGFRVVKFFLHVSKEEQKQRFLARIDIPDKNWKFSASDIHERQYWPKYQQAYQQAIRETATPDSPWYVIPADDKWTARLIAARVLIDQLKQLPLAYPAPTPKQTAGLSAAKRELLQQ